MTPYLLSALLTGTSLLPQQAVDTTYSRLVREATTDVRFLPASVATLPEAPEVPSPLQYFGTIAGAPGTAHKADELYGYYRALAEASPPSSLPTANGEYRQWVGMGNAFLEVYFD